MVASTSSNGLTFPPLPPSPAWFSSPFAPWPPTTSPSGSHPACRATRSPPPSPPAPGRPPSALTPGSVGGRGTAGARGKLSGRFRNPIPSPAPPSFPEAAPLPLDMVTAWHMLVARAQFRPGETLLIQAGGSGIGSAAIQIAKLWNAGRIFTTVGSAEKTERARALGADETILYRETDFPLALLRLPN